VVMAGPRSVSRNACGVWDILIPIYGQGVGSRLLLITGAVRCGGSGYLLL
jgi:hypothetical protein